MIVFPKQFTTTRVPGYFWNVEEKKLYSIKSGILKPIAMTRPARPWNKNRKGYIVSDKGKRKFLDLKYLNSLCVLDKTIEVVKSMDNFRFISRGRETERRLGELGISTRGWSGDQRGTEYAVFGGRLMKSTEWKGAYGNTDSYILGDMNHLPLVDIFRAKPKEPSLEEDIAALEKKHGVKLNLKDLAPEYVGEGTKFIVSGRPAVLVKSSFAHMTLVDTEKWVYISNSMPTYGGKVNYKDIKHYLPEGLIYSLDKGKK